MSQLSEDGLLPRLLARRNRADVPWFATALTAGMAILFLLSGDPVWVIAAANFCYLLAIGLPSIAVWLLRRDAPQMARPYRAPRGTVMLGVFAASGWGLATLLGFQQFGLPTVLAGLALAYSGSFAYAWRKRDDRRRTGETAVRYSIHAKLAGAMILVMTLDGGGYLLAVTSVDHGKAELVSALSDIFVAVALLTVAVGLVLPGIISHATQEVAKAADRLARGTLSDFTRAMQALSQGKLEQAHAVVEVEPVRVRARDEVGAMADSFNLMLEEVGRATVALDGAREGLRATEGRLKRNIDQQAAVVSLGQRALEGVELERLMEEVVTTVSTILGAEIVAIIAHADGERRVCAATGLGGRQRLTSEAIDAWPTATSAGSDGTLEAMTDVVETAGMSDALTVSIPGADAPFGELCCRTRTDRTFSADELEFLQAIAILLADAIARRGSEDEIRHQALHDLLTGLPNRLLFLDRLRLALAQEARRESSVAILFMDFDRFKLVNDSLGHAVGDELLMQIAARLDSLMRGGDTLARFGGDEFVVICEGLLGPEQAEMIAQRVTDALRQPFVVGGENELVVRASIGIAISHGDGDAESLIAEADAAMYRAKQHGGGQTETFDEVMRGDASSELHLENDLAKALDRDQLRVLYQPIVALDSDRVVGFEALVRWQHPERGLVNPADFIALAEANGMILPIGRWVLQQACRQAASWRESTAAGLTIAVNLSLRQFREPQLPLVVAGALRDAGLDPSALHLEITESAMMDQTERTLETLDALKMLGVAIHLDDFGTGYSSLAHLQRFPIDTLKIDRSFVAALERDSDGETIVAAIVNMARSLQIDVVAEGIETRKQAEKLHELGCRLAQGYLFSRPVSDLEAVALLDVELPLRTVETV